MRTRSSEGIFNPMRYTSCTVFICMHMLKIFKLFIHFTNKETNYTIKYEINFAIKFFRATKFIT